MFEPLKYAGDFVHLTAIYLLAFQINRHKSCRGMSYRTQEMYLVVFITRYCMTFSHPMLHVYASIMKILFLLGTFLTIFMMRYKRPHSLTYEKMHDKVPHYYIIYPIVIVLTVLFHITIQHHVLKEYLWSFSIILEAFVLLPQLYMLRLVTDLRVFTTKYVLCLGLYRLLYVFTWVQRGMFETLRIPPYLYLEMIFGLLQTCFLTDFVYNLVKHSRDKQIITIPI